MNKTISRADNRRVRTVRTVGSGRRKRVCMQSRVMSTLANLILSEDPTLLRKALSTIVANDALWQAATASHETMATLEKFGIERYW